jgi:preprotein translocase subunit SecG
MLKLFLVIISIFLITLIFLRVPQENVGLASFATKSNLLESPSSAQTFLNILIAFGILLYFILAIARLKEVLAMGL